MRTMGLYGDVTSNTSVTPYGTEPGCRVLIYRTDIDSVQTFFNQVQKVHGDVGCAHVRNVPNIVEGCIWNAVNREKNSMCPQRYNEKCADVHRA